MQHFSQIAPTVCTLVLFILHEWWCEKDVENRREETKERGKKMEGGREGGRGVGREGM